MLLLYSTLPPRHIQNGKNTLFWTDKWILGCSIADIAPNVLEKVPVRTQNTRLVVDDLQNQDWVDDIQGALSMVGLYEYFQLWDSITNIILTQKEDIHSWKLAPSGQYSSSTAYRAFFNGSTTFEPWRPSWKSWAPPKCKIFL
ncbi:hypothetical protein PR202_gn00345 [Eleusine coracana subsp. coracana]|uniref:Uncharacterized protein n=1 Tax=Eleusine coracana subsp. coracana TaxID=191504 RepID=A0AAV5FZD1_ELECO|nr:hypothetical protein PR202_gn00345 [Eleusine coracana subsp. coracana]